MDNQPLPTNSLPQVVVTESSPVSVETESVGSLVKKIESNAEVTANGGPSESVKQSVDQTAVAPEPSSNLSSGEFVAAQECTECIVPVPEEPPAPPLESVSTATSEPDNFRTTDVGCCTSYGIKCMEYYGKAWNIIHTWYALPFWLSLLALPLSAGYMGTLYMYSCPASHSLPMLMFTIAVSLMAGITFRICLIFCRINTTVGDEWRNMLHTLMSTSSFLTMVFFITESMAFWRMEPTSQLGASNYCDPDFVTFSFWWNCVMCVVMVPTFLFPA